ncbi:MAG: hypothetical protein B1H13_01250 [Desulfobacteraceae bacterium 4484_190.3]|nr:MAG: hypothetical protein B1H13_01250 [Desulfobacteraceae bacterium 4484_190.3]
MGNPLGTLGSGNHFLEIQVVDAIYDSKKAKSFGLLLPFHPTSGAGISRVWPAPQTMPGRTARYSCIGLKRSFFAPSE